MNAKARFEERIWELSEQATEDCAAFEPPEEPPAPERAMTYLRQGAGPAVSIYVEARTGRHMIHFPPDEYHALEGTMNAYLDLYGACYGADIQPQFTIRKAAELLIDTHNIKDVAQILTGIPDR